MKELYTLIIGAGFSLFLIYIYTAYKIKKLHITKSVIAGDKSIKRMYYILKKNGFKVLKMGKSFKFFIFFNNRRITNELHIDAIVKKEKKYLCFITDSDDVTQKMILYSMVTGILNGLLINVMDFSFKEYKIKI